MAASLRFLAPVLAALLLSCAMVGPRGGHMLARDLPMQVKAPGKAQYPLASVVSCTDSRSAPELVFDPGVGDVGRSKGRPHQYVLS